MKLSNYVIDNAVTGKKRILYSIVTRKYYTYSKEKKQTIWSLLEDLNKSEYTLEEAKLIKELYSKGIIVDDRLDEIEYLGYAERKSVNKDSILRLTIYLTNACNFRCTYCQQAHHQKNIEDDTVSNITQLIMQASKEKRTIHITWFGGEPLLQYGTMIDILEKVLPVCEGNGCKVVSSIVTNGYLLDSGRAKQLHDLGVNTMQITVDGSEENHNKTRVLANGNGTYTRVIQGLEAAAENDIKVILRMNISKTNYKQNYQVLETIKEPLRKNIVISIANVFQEKEKVSSFEIKKYAYELGYRSGERFNNFHGCLTCGHNSIVVNTDGKILFCSNCEDDEEIGYLKKDGKVVYKNRMLYDQLVDKSVIQNEACRKCKELPLCLGGCRYHNAYGSGNDCKGKRADGMSLEEVAFLDFYYDSLNSEGA